METSGSAPGLEEIPQSAQGVGADSTERDLDGIHEIRLDTSLVAAVQGDNRARRPIDPNERRHAQIPSTAFERHCQMGTTTYIILDRKIHRSCHEKDRQDQ